MESMSNPATSRHAADVDEPEPVDAAIPEVSR
jgi:hypothetical protein